MTRLYVSEALSMSVASSVPLMTLSSLPLAAPFCATGASFTGLTVRLIVAVLDVAEPLSVALKLKLSAPLKFGAGV